MPRYGKHAKGARHVIMEIGSATVLDGLLPCEYGEPSRDLINRILDRFLPASLQAPLRIIVGGWMAQ